MLRLPAGKASWAAEGTSSDRHLPQSQAVWTPSSEVELAEAAARCSMPFAESVMALSAAGATRPLEAHTQALWVVTHPAE